MFQIFQEIYLLDFSRVLQWPFGEFLICVPADFQIRKEDLKSRTAAQRGDVSDGGGGGGGSL